MRTVCWPGAVVIVIIIAALLGSLPCAAQPTTAPTAPGVILRFESADGKSIDLREARLIALSVPNGTSPSAFVPPGQFRATFHGFVNMKLRDQYAFTAAGRGEFELLINGDSVLKNAGDDLAGKSSELIRLKKGSNEIIVRYTAPAESDALFRLSWAEKNRTADPVPPMVLTHSDDPALAAKQEIRAGRELVATRHCLNCHAPPAPLGAHLGAMPELSADAPNLDGVGSRLNPQWMALWIADPKQVRADATMPKVFARAGTEQAGQAVARDIAAYLATRKAALPDQGLVDLGEPRVVAGARLFLNLGCIACHPSPAAKDDPARVSLGTAAAKYQPAALRAYLKKPEAHYDWTRMPNFALSDDEAGQLEAFLTKSSPAKALEPVDLTEADPQRGKLFFELTGCMRCHEPQQKSVTRARPLADLMQIEWSAGCVTDDPAKRGNAPDFGFTESERASLRSFGKTDAASLVSDAPPEFAERAIRSLNCLACHTRDAQQDVWSTLSAEIAAIEQTLPPAKPPQSDQQRPLLTWVGEKLRPEWMTQFIAGKVNYKPRPWLVARMPAFPSRAGSLALGMCLEHGLPFSTEAQPPVDPELASIGRRLSGRVGGFSCNQCHAINQTPALVPFDSPAPNFMYISQRLRKDYYDRWTRSPSKYQPGTKMPTFADLEGKTAYKTILDGDAGKQFNAIWQYLRAGREIAPPE